MGVVGEPSFVIVGTGRSGTRYIADLLSAAGISTGHEAWWSHTGEEARGYDGDSSWFAAPHLDGYTGRIFHQVRDPLFVVNSLVKSPERGQADEARRRSLILRGDVVEQAVTITLGWRRMCDALPLAGRWRVEDVGAHTIEHVSDATGLAVRDVEETLEQTPRTVNWHGNAAFTYGWSDLPPSPETRELMRAAERDGYL